MANEKKPTAGDETSERTADANEETTRIEKPEKKNGGKGKGNGGAKTPKKKLTKQELKDKARIERQAKEDVDKAKADKKQKAEEARKRESRDKHMADAADTRNEKAENRLKAKEAADKKRKEAAELRSKADEIEAALENPEYAKPVFDDEDTDEYWVGTVAGSPIQNITVGGMGFPRFTDKVTPGKGIRTLRSTGVGIILVMTHERVEAVKQAIRDRALRPGNPPIKINLKKKKLRRSDRPLGDFVYLMTTDEAADRYGARWRENAPDCFSKTDDE